MRLSGCVTGEPATKFQARRALTQCRCSVGIVFSTAGGPNISRGNCGGRPSSPQDWLEVPCLFWPCTLVCRDPSLILPASFAAIWDWCSARYLWVVECGSSSSRSGSNRIASPSGRNSLRHFLTGFANLFTSNSRNGFYFAQTGHSHFATTTSAIGG